MVMPKNSSTAEPASIDTTITMKALMLEIKVILRTSPGFIPAASCRNGAIAGMLLATAKIPRK